MFERKRRN